MTKFILVRHGKPTYDEIENFGFMGYGVNFAPLTAKGILEVKKNIEDDVFENSDILISSPYTRAMQTASIIGNKYDLDVNVELALHEWVPDVIGNYISKAQMIKNLKIAKRAYQGKTKKKDLPFLYNIEPLENVKNRGLMVLDKYSNYDKVIVVTHGMLINMLTGEKLDTGEHTVLDYEKVKKMAN